MHKTVLLFTIAALCSLTSFGQKIVHEEMIHLNEDGKSFLVYYTTRSSFSAYAMPFNPAIPIDEQYDFISPNEYEVSDGQLIFRPGEYAMMKRGVFNVKISDNGVYDYHRSSKPNRYGRIGVSNHPTDFDHLVYVWILPERFEYVSYTSNQEDKGEWKLRGNVLAYYGKNVNDFVPHIKYKLVERQPDEFKDRKVEVRDRVIAPSTKIPIKIWDDLEEDGDIISLSLNGEWVLRNYKVKKESVEIELNLDRRENYLLMYAENLGEIAPNTAVVEIANKKIKLSSDLRKSDSIKIVRR